MPKINPLVNPNARMVSGPINVIRMEGDLHGIRKVIYIFMDYHLDVGMQTQCKNIFSKDVQKYFIDSFYKLSKGNNTKMYDFFPEVFPSELVEEKHLKENTGIDYHEKYIEEVAKFFIKIFKFDPKQNKVKLNEVFKNIRLHYIDIRDYFKHTVSSKIYSMLDIANSFMSSDDIDTEDLELIIELMELLRDHLQFTIYILSNKKHYVSNIRVIKGDVSKSIDVKSLEYLSNKIRNVYQHRNVKKIMNQLINFAISNFDKTIMNIDRAIERFLGYRNSIIKNNNKLTKDENNPYKYGYGLSTYTIRYMIIDIVNTIEYLVDGKFTGFFAIITDIFFMRRFLDKDYITNAITYTGAMHSNMYIYTLINYFNFKITHASYSKIENVNKLTNEIRKRSFDEIQGLLLPEYLVQCSDMTNFPEDFL